MTRRRGALRAVATIAEVVGSPIALAIAVVAGWHHIWVGTGLGLYLAYDWGAAAYFRLARKSEDYPYPGTPAACVVVCAGAGATLVTSLVNHDWILVPLALYFGFDFFLRFLVITHRLESDGEDPRRTMAIFMALLLARIIAMVALLVVGITYGGRS